MFDDPKKSLDRLQKELLAAEQEDDFRDVEALLDEDWDEDEREPLAQTYAEEEYEAEYSDEEPPQAPPQKRKEDNRGLIVAMILEFLGLLAIAGWWYLCR